MRFVIMAMLAACGVDGGDSGHVTIIPVDAGSNYEPTEQPDVSACTQLAAGDDPKCDLWCTDWHSFAALATPGACAMAECPLLDGTTFYPSVCIDPK